MGWLTELSTVYDAVNKGPSKDNKPLPLYHIENNAPLTVILDGQGKFRNATLLGTNKEERADWQTCMPCTETSASRTSGVDAYPLCDKLEYVAGDYEKYASGKKLKEKNSAYLSLLKDWAESEYSDEKIKAVYSYVKKGVLVKDLLHAKIPEIKDASDIEAYNGFIRWAVEIPGEKENRTWKDTKIQRLWIQYYKHRYLNKSGFCYVSGKNTPIAVLHPAKIRNAGDSAKIISSNDKANYTFRGRFEEADQACQIGMEISTKAHNALRWLIAKQGTPIGNGLTVVCWCSAPQIKPEIMKSTQEIPGDDDEDEDVYSTRETLARKINKRLRGYYNDLKTTDKIIIMGLNAATPGRMSILLYREFSKTDFFEAQEYWHEHLAWFYSYWDKNTEKTAHAISAPSPIEIAKAAYGEHLNDHVKTMAIQRILPCILYKTPIPQDIEQLCIGRASRLGALKESEKAKTLETACAVFKYNAYTRNKEDYNVGLEEDRTDRDYLYGRLLAVADRVESRVLYKRKEERETNAVRYMQRFSKYPCSTWKILYVDKLRPYFSYLPKKSRDWYKALIQEIEFLFNHDDYVSDKALSGEFLLGYHCQQKAFWEGVAKSKAQKQPEPTEEDD
ncbi:type I-C CRISPR-associated protein Cas8c/Csd1 [Treponema sp. TIM-1]|uniref:type I-C CRISPR-associated protein Cas8c/Csd1 n=1 Tax=Treponema sp. TIM-1 TaxID=2898417 RepID=UPI00398173EA